jgi:signal peptidase
LVRGVDVRTIRRGDVIVFNVPAPYDGHTPSPIVHRVIDVKADGGEVYFVTKGDNNPSADTWAVPAGNVIGKYAGRVPYMGLPVLFLKTPYGLAVVAALMLLWIFYPHRKRVGGGKVSVR